jgi:hypothetical protein
MDEKQKEELREIIDGQSFGNYQDMVTAKENLDTIAKSVKDLFAITPGHFKKLVKLNYEKSIEAERRKFIEINDLYIDLFEPDHKVTREELKEMGDNLVQDFPKQAVERFNDELLKDETIKKGAK